MHQQNHTKRSFRAALRAGCHLCHLIDENRSYEYLPHNEFPHLAKYAFKVLSKKWARHGKGPKWLVPVIHTGDDDTEVSMYLREVQKDPTANGLAQLLATDSDELFNTHRDFWLVLEFYGPGAHLVLPLELATGRSRPSLILSPANQRR